MVKILN